MKNIGLTLFMTIIILTGCSSEEAESEDINAQEIIDTTIVEDNNEVQTITFNETPTTDGNAQITGNDVLITTGGDYKVVGESSNGQVIINAPDQEVNLILDNVDLTANYTSALTVIDAKQLNIELVGENTLSDTVENTDDYQAPLFIDEVETYINGDGTLNLYGNYQEGLESNNDLYIQGGNYNVVAVDDGINTGDLLDISGGSIFINSGGDGLDSNGDLAISGGDIFVSSGNNGNGPIDYGDIDATFDLSGGNLIAVGGSMGVIPTTYSQTYLNNTTNGTSISVDGIDYEAPKSFSYFFISTPTLTTDTEILVDGVIVDATTQQTTSGSVGGGRATPPA